MSLLLRRRALMMQLVKKIIKTIAGALPLVLDSAIGKPLINYKLEGNSVQDGEPTPEAPIEVESVGEKTINLFEKKTDSISTNAAYKGLDMREWEQTTYTLQIKLKEGKTIPSGVYFGFVYIDSAAYWLVDNGVINSKYNGMVSINTATINGVCCYPANKSEAFWDAFDIFLVQGAYTIDTMPDFESIGYKIPVVAQGKNLFDINNTEHWVITSSYHYYSIYVGANQTITASWDTDLTKGQGFYLCIGNTSAEKGESANSTWLYHSTASDGTRNKAVTVKADADGYIYINMAPLNYDKIQKLQIEYGNTVTEFEPFQEPIVTNIYLNEPLRKAGDYSDYIDFANGKVVRNVGYGQLLSTHGFTKSGMSTTDTTVITVHPSLSPFGKAKVNTRGLSAFCNIGKGCYGNDWLDKGVIYWSYNTNSTTFFGVPNSILNELGFENSLQGVKDYIDYQNNITPIIITFVLKTPTEELIELPQLPTHKGTTVYTIDTTIQPSNMEVTYYS